MNTKLLREVKKHILEEPKRYDQNNYMETGADAEAASRFGVAQCGMLGCIAGWTVVLGQPARRAGLCCDWFNEGRRLLELTSEQANRLFAGFSRPDDYYDDDDDDYDSWPLAFRSRYYRAKTARGRALVAAERIEHFIKTKGEE